MDANAYLDRIGLTDVDAADVTPGRSTLEHVVSAHVRSVPFENLSIVGDPHGPARGDGVSLDLPDLYEKIVERERGGFCFELNGAFGWLLRELGYDADRCAARIADADSLGRPPANHHTLVVRLDRPYLVDAATATPQPRMPIPIDGEAHRDSVGVEWRVEADDTALSDYVLRLREPGEDWRVRYRFQTTPRTLSFFEATCEFLANEPGGTFTSGPLVQRSTRAGAVSLDGDTLTRDTPDGTTETDVPPEDWHDVLAREFDLRL